MRHAFLLLLLALSAYAQNANLAFDRYVLPNGIEVILHPDRKTPIAHFNLTFRAGSKNEPPGRSGLAHLLEHLLFNGHGSGSDYGAAAERLGAIEANAGTGDDSTEYYDTVPSHLLERMLWMESNRFAEFSTGITQDKLDKQRAVVINEKRMRFENAPYWRVDPLIRETMFPPGHPYHHDAGGEYADLRAITLDDVRSFYSTYYTSDRLTLVMVGDFDPAQAKQWIVKYFGFLTPGNGLAEVPRYSPTLTEPRTIEVSDRVRMERVWFVWPAPPYASRDEAALTVAARILGAETSPLVKALNQKLSLGVSVTADDMQDASTFSLIVSIVPGQKPADVETTGLAELERFAREGPKAEELDRLKNRLELDRLGELETLYNLAEAIRNVRLNYGSIDHWNEWTARYSSLTADDIRGAVSRWLVGPNHLTVHVTPLDAAPGAAPPDRKTEPPAAPEKPFHLPQIQTARLPNGIEIFVTERHDLPKIAAEIRFRVGMLQAPPAKPAIASLAAAVAVKGTTTRKAADIEAESARLAIDASAAYDASSEMAGFETLRRSFEPAFRLLADIVRNPTYPAGAVEHQKKDWIDAREKPEAGDTGFGPAALSAVFGDQHPLGAGFGSTDSIRSITPQEVRDFHDRYWKPDAAALVFSGDITLKDAVALATDCFGNWTGASPPAPKMPPPSPKPGRLFLVDRKGNTQTMVAQVLPAVPRTSTEYPALLAVTAVLGGISESRLRTNIRQENGIAYYAASVLPTFATVGLLESFSQVQTDRTGFAIRQFQQELAALTGSKPITAEELASAKAALLRGIPGSYETVWGTAEKIAENWAAGLPLNEDQLFADRVNALTLDQVRAAARKYAQPAAAIFVLIGDREQIEPQLKDLNLGAVTILK